MWRRYQNELMILIALLLLAGAVLFKTYQHTALEKQDAEAAKMVSQIEDIATMQKLWLKNKTIPQKLIALKHTLGKAKIKTFELKKKKAHILLENLHGSELNKIVGKQLASIPIQIEEMTIERSGETYRLELRCKW